MKRRICKGKGCDKETGGFWCVKHSPRYRKKGTRVTALRSRARKRRYMEWQTIRENSNILTNL